jgi:hypothetical protein
MADAHIEFHGDEAEKFVDMKIGHTFKREVALTLRSITFDEFGPHISFDLSLADAAEETEDLGESFVKMTENIQGLGI